MIDQKRDSGETSGFLDQQNLPPFVLLDPVTVVTDSVVPEHSGKRKKSSPKQQIRKRKNEKIPNPRPKKVTPKPKAASTPKATRKGASHPQDASTPKEATILLGSNGRQLNVLSQTDVYNGPGAKPNRAPVHVADLSQDQQELLASHINSQHCHKATMTEPAMTFLTAEEVAGYVCINYVGKKLDGFEKKLDSFESVVRSVEKQLRRLVACEVLEAVSGDVTVPDAFDVNDAPVSACDVNDNSVVSLSDAVCHDVVSIGHDSICLSGGSVVSNGVMTVAGCETSCRANPDASIAGSLVGHDSLYVAGGFAGYHSVSEAGGFAGRDGLSIGGGVIGTGGFSVGGSVVGRDGLSIGGGVVDTGVFSLVGGVVGGDGLSIGGGVVGTGGFSVGDGVVGRDGLSMKGGVVGTGGFSVGGGVVGGDDLSIGGGVVGTGGLSVGGGVVGRTGLSAGGAVVGRDGLSIGGGVVGTGGFSVGGGGVGRNGLSSGDGVVGRNGLSAGGGVVDRNGLSSGGGVVGRNGLSAGGGVVGRNGLSSGDRVVGRNGLCAGGGVVGRNGLSAGGGVVDRNGLSAGDGVVGRNGLSAGDGVVGRNGLSAGGGVVGRNGLSSGGGVVGRNGLSSGGGVVGRNGLSSGDGVVSRNGLSAGDGVVGRNGLSAGGGVVGHDGLAVGHVMEGQDVFYVGGGPVGLDVNSVGNGDIRWGVRSRSGFSDLDVVNNGRLFDNVSDMISPHVGYGERDRELNSGFIVYENSRDDDMDDDLGGKRVVSADRVPLRSRFEQLPVVIRSYIDMQSVSKNAPVMLHPDILDSLITQHDGNISRFVWDLTKLLYSNEEMIDSSFNGKGTRKALSPRRKSLILNGAQQAFPGVGKCTQYIATAINNGLKNKRTYQKKN
ncbi:trimeric autotransporter adhesin AtaA-like isoform X10 [Dreissena polymorpha]|uniref:trimeric autotransporter adhesin AtaA-like isoform X10 n=1 Tax=Dreissena polymorpha TaxID=45954 RepID=UPI002264F59D|nr:trimeric autotransporter adhesin AtaA-like isoform X10 [Dreissena polymorpha]